MKIDDKYLGEIINKNKSYIEDSKVADYIPALAKANKEDIGIYIKTNKDFYKSGSVDEKFTIQSISKVISLMQALFEHGEEYVFTKVGYEGTDEPFNTGYKLDLPNIDKPANPMINSGAILTTSLIEGSSDEKFNKILELTRILADNPELTYNKEVYLSEKATGDKNRALAYQMKARGMLEGDVEASLSAYFKQCSIEVDVRDLANIANFIANGCKGLEYYGKIDEKQLTKILLSIMNNCGMYNYSSQYGVEVGIPAKSGVGGGIMAVVPGKMGIGTYSPGLDENGNSKVGIEILKDLSEEFDLNIYL